jgi:GT2 family glycosyltransferase
LANPPKVSVVIAVRDGERWLLEAVDSVLVQTMSDLELIIVDDASTDRTPEIVANSARCDSRIRPINQLKSGLAAALNRGFAEARAPFLARLDADDIAKPQRIQRQFEYLDRHPGVALLGTWAETIDGQGRVIGYRKPAVKHDELVRILVNNNPLIHSSIMLRTELARKAGLYRRAFEAAEDYDLWLRIDEIGRVEVLPEFLVQYRWHRANVSQSNVVRQIFSVRLAKRSSQMRKSGSPDLASALTEPPDFYSVQSPTAFFAQDARLCRFLDLADPERAQEVNVAQVDISDLTDQLPQLSHVERKLGQLAIYNLLRRKHRPAHLRTFMLSVLLFRLHPGRAMSLIWRAVVLRS